jgi:hypothetical protein
MILDYQQNINKPHDVNFHKTALTGWYLWQGRHSGKEWVLEQNLEILEAWEEL